MAEKSKLPTPPYTTYASFKAILNKLRDEGIPSRIDPSIFKNTSGSIVYGVLAALKYLNLIDEQGNPSSDFKALIAASDEARPPILREVIIKGYPKLFDGTLDPLTMTAGQFDQHVREEYQAQGSTIDKVAAFFIASAKDAGIDLSPHLKNRQTIATASSKKTQRKAKSDRADVSIAFNAPTAPTSAVQVAGKPLEYQLIDLMSEPDIADEVKTSIWNLVQYLTARKAKKSATQET